MRRSIFLKTLGSYRTAILGWGLGMGLLMLVVVSAYDSAVGSVSAKDKQAFLLAFQSIGWLWDFPKALSSTGGYATAKYSFFVALVAIWGLLAGTRLLRGEEESGQLDMLLSMPRSRARVAVEKVSALLVALLLIGAFIGLFAFAGVSTVKTLRFSFAAAMEEGLMISLLAASIASIGLFVSQFTRHRGSAAGITGGLFALAFVLNSIGLVSPQNEWVGRLSPVYYFRISKPLVEDYGMNWGAAGILVVFVVVFAGAAAVLFLSRDVGSVIPVVPAGVSLPGGHLAAPQSGWSLRSLASRAIAIELPRAFWWAVGLGAFFTVFTAITRQLQLNLLDDFKGTIYEPIFKAMAGGSSASGNAFFLNLLISYIPLLVAAMAVTQVNGWERTEAEGQLDLVLATPQTRAKAMLARIGAAALGIVFVVAVAFGAILLAAARASLTLDTGNLAQAVLGSAPWGLIVLAAGFLLATWIRRSLLVTVLSILLAATYGIQLAGAAAGWPDAVQGLALFHYYGSPMINGLDWTAVGVILGVTVVLTALAVWRFAAKDIGRWTFLPGLRLPRRRQRQAALAQ
ncbi:MAG TPA: ABC transporter permease subunit [Ktedonobacterales bacterium]